MCIRDSLNRKYLTAVTPLPDHVLQVDFVSGSRLLLDMQPYLDQIRLRPLADARVWNSAGTNGIFVRFGDVDGYKRQVLLSVMVLPSLVIRPAKL